MNIHRHEQLTHEYTLAYTRRENPGQIRAGDRAVFRGPDYRAIQNARFHHVAHEPVLYWRWRVIWQIAKTCAAITGLVAIALYAAH